MQTMKFNLFWLCIAGLLLPLSLQAQLEMPAASPFCKIEQKVGLTDVSIAYSRPSMNGRKIMGALVPYGEMWRTGANASTKLSFSDDVKLNGHEVPAGTYALYTIPGESEWTIILHKNTNHWGTGGANYKQEEDLLRFQVKAETLPVTMETFTIEIGDLKTESAKIWLLWERTGVPIDLQVEVDKRVMAQIDRILNGPTAGTYYQMANYYYTQQKDDKQALEWVNKAIEGGDRYWVWTLKARLHARLGDYENAIAASQKAMQLAEGNNPDYVRLNKELIAQWKEEQD